MEPLRRVQERHERDERNREGPQQQQLAAAREGASEGGQQVRVRIPLRLVDALLAPGENTLDVAAAMRVLSESGAGDLVTVTGGDESVRIWVDDVASPDEGASR